MKKEITYLLGAILSCTISLSGTAQIGQGGTPYSFNHNLTFDDQSAEVNIAKPDMAAVIAEDALYTDKNDLYRVGKNIAVNLTPVNSGEWITSPNGEKIWKLTVKSEGALALGFYYNAFEIPEGGEVFIYNETKTHVIGAFTHNNAEKNIGSTQMIEGDEVTIEYHANKEVTTLPQIDIFEVVYFYRGVEDFITPFDKDATFQEKADNCQVDILCAPERNGNENQINSVIHYTFSQGGGTYVCSAAMLNNTAEDFTPYVLTAWHCGEPNAGTSLSGWVWYWKYQKNSCSPGAANASDPGKGNKTMAGGTVRASSGSGTLNNPPGNNQLAGSDFYLVELQTTPPNSYDAFYAGWDRTNNAGTDGVGIHHPSGSAKKISTYTQTLLSSTYNGGASNAHWSVRWAATTNGHGVTEGGSSGSPIFNEAGRVVGQLSGGSSFCTNTSARDLYGKMYTNWDLCGSTDGAQLEPWLDPSGTGATGIDGIYKPGTSAAIKENELNDNITVYPNPSNGTFNLMVSLETKENVTIEVLNSIGQSLSVTKFEKVDELNLDYDLTNYSKGIYFIKVSNNAEFSLRKIIIE